MKSLALVSRVIAILAIVLSTVQLSAKSTDNPAADQMFRQAMAAAVRGDSAEHDRLLAESLQRYPDYELARWYSGQVEYDGQWKSIDSVSESVSTNPMWQEYQARLAQLGDSLQEQTAMARWCHSNDLSYQEKWHWLSVLAVDPKNREALGSLGLRIYKGQYLTSEQIDEYERREELAEADYKKFTKQFDRWLKTAIRGNSQDMQSLVNKIAAIEDNAAIPALVDTFYLDGSIDKSVQKKLGKERGEELLSNLRRAVIQSLSNMKQPEATRALLEIAVEWPQQDVATLAAEGLKEREKTSFMPALMGAMSSPLEAAISIRVAPSGQVSVYEDIAEIHPLAEKSHFQTSKYLTQYSLTLNDSTTVTDYRGMRSWRDSPKTTTNSQSVTKVWSDRVRDFNNATAQATSTRDRVDQENALREQRNSRVQDVLKIVTGKDLGSEPKAWWDSWKHYNELYTPEQLPVYETADSRDYSQYYYQYQYRRNNYSVGTPPPAPPRTYSCFVAGTPVWTQTGPVAIETVQVGDMVLSQDPFTGELDYRPVMETSVGPLSPILNLKIENETLGTTRGHRFWVANSGWKMSKFLEPGNRLVALGGYPELHQVEEGKESQAFNLVVGQFHTYFVGNQKLLVHDKNCPLPTTNTLPGVEQLATTN